MILLLPFIIAGLAWIFIKSNAINKRIQQQLAAFVQKYRGWQVFMTDTLLNRSVLGIGIEQRRVVLGTLENHLEVDWADICQIEVISNGTSLTTTNRGSQLLGGVVGNALLGPLGMLVGGVTGSKATRQRVNDLVLKITIDDEKRPVHRVVFLQKGGKGYTPSSPRLKAAVERLDHFHALLLSAMRTVERERAPAPVAIPAVIPAASEPPALSANDGDLSRPGFEDKLERLWALHQAGALTEAEYAERKQRLLAENAG